MNYIVTAAAAAAAAAAEPATGAIAEIVAQAEKSGEALAGESSNLGLHFDRRP
jgi:hypothetical protein